MLLERIDKESILLIKGEYYSVKGIDKLVMLVEIYDNGCLFEYNDFERYPQEIQTTKYVAKFEDVESQCPF